MSTKVIHYTGKYRIIKVMNYILGIIFFAIFFSIASSYIESDLIKCVIYYVLSGIILSSFIINDNIELNLIEKLKKLNNDKNSGLHFHSVIFEKHIEKIQNQIKLFKFIISEKEKIILQNNILSLKMFEKSRNYKYIMIAMGSILEFLLIKYYEKNNIRPKNNNDFINCVQYAIETDLFRQKKKWSLVQSHLRDFRNYVHINKECSEEEIDEEWYDSMKPIFKSLFNSFKSDSP